MTNTAAPVSDSVTNETSAFDLPTNYAFQPTLKELVTKLPVKTN